MRPQVASEADVDSVGGGGGWLSPPAAYDEMGAEPQSRLPQRRRSLSAQLEANPTGSGPNRGRFRPRH